MNLILNPSTSMSMKNHITIGITIAKPQHTSSRAKQFANLLTYQLANLPIFASLKTI
ncbi:MAG: hypothetical protein IPJ26_11100 [Bacteroidetes bacterium]|nr:hypothetical protein [Bacteroidota bacterium]